MKSNQQGSHVARRHMLTGVFTHPQDTLAQSQETHGSGAPVPEEDLAPYRAAMARFWQQSKEAHLPSMDHLRSTLLVPLEQRFSELPTGHPQQSELAHLLSQAYQLMGILFFHQNDIRQRAQQCYNAVQWARVTNDPHLALAASLKLGVTFYYAKQPQKAQEMYQSVLAQSEQASPLLQSSLRMKWAAACAQVGQGHEALNLLAEAYRLFPSHPEDDPAFLYADCGASSLALWDGLTHLALGDQRIKGLADPISLDQASRVFHEVSGRHALPVISRRNHLEIVNHQTIVAALLGDLEMTEASLSKGIVGARSLSSARRYAEAIEGYRLARSRWPEEMRIRHLAGLFLEDLPPQPLS